MTVAVGCVPVGEGVGELVGPGVTEGVIEGVTDGEIDGPRVTDGVIEGVTLGVGDGPAVGVKEGDKCKVKLRVQALLPAAMGFTCGTFGATASLLANFWLVRKITTPKPRVIKSKVMIYQYFLNIS